MFNLQNFNFRRVIRKKLELEPQEIFLDSLAQRKEEEMGVPYR